MDEKSVRQELVHSLNEYGANKSHHRRFRERVLAEVVAQFSSRNDSSAFDHLINEKYPSNYEDAIRHFFRQEAIEYKEKFRYVLEDKLSGLDAYRSPPFFRRYERNNRSKIIGYGLKDDFKKAVKRELDPFLRFSFSPPSLSESESLFEEWFLSDEDALDGMLFEAILTCHAIHNEACFNTSCMARNSLRWYGGYKSSWMDMVCIACNSTYEIKTKADMEMCVSRVERNRRLYGGSYERYWMHRNAINDSRSKNQKMFLVLIPRNFAINKKGEKFRPVYCKEIDHVIPHLKAQVFRVGLPTPAGFTMEQKKKYETIPMKSEIILKCNKKRENDIWFQLKNRDPINFCKIMMEVFIEFYSKEEFDRVESLLCKSEPENDDFSKGKSIQNAKAENECEKVKRLKNEIEALKIVADDSDENCDWETMYSSDD